MGSGAYAPAPLVAAGLGLPEEHHLDVLTTRARRRQRLAEDPLVVHEVPYLHYRRVGARVAVDAALIAIAGGPERVVAEASVGVVLADAYGHVLVRAVHAVDLLPGLPAACRRHRGPLCPRCHRARRYIVGSIGAPTKRAAGRFFSYLSPFVRGEGTAHVPSLLPATKAR